MDDILCLTAWIIHLHITQYQYLSFSKETDFFKYKWLLNIWLLFKYKWLLNKWEIRKEWRNKETNIPELSLSAFISDSWHLCRWLVIFTRMLLELKYDKTLLMIHSFIYQWIIEFLDDPFPKGYYDNFSEVEIINFYMYCIT